MSFISSDDTDEQKIEDGLVVCMHGLPNNLINGPHGDDRALTSSCPAQAADRTCGTLAAKPRKQMARESEA